MWKNILYEYKKLRMYILVSINQYIYIYMYVKVYKLNTLCKYSSKY